MSEIKIFVKDEKEKAELIKSYLCGDEAYLEALDDLKKELTEGGTDMNTPEGKKTFILAVRKLNKKFIGQGNGLPENS